MLNLADPVKRSKHVSVYEALMLMLAFAALVVRLLDNKNDKK